MWTPETMAGARVGGRTMEPGDVVRCRCGRHVQAQMMTRVGQLPAEARAPGAPDYLCDACRVQIVRRGLMSQADMVEALGAPPAVVARFRERGR